MGEMGSSAVAGRSSCLMAGLMVATVVMVAMSMPGATGMLALS